MPNTVESVLSEQMDKVLSRVAEIKAKADKEASLLVDPKREYVMRAIKVVEAFLREKDLIVYGGSAINAAILVKNPERRIYDPAVDIPDLDFYSPSAIKHGIELCNRLLEEDGVDHVQMKEALHQGTFKINVNHHEAGVADISRLPPRLYRYVYECCTFVGDKGIRYVDPNFQVVDLYTAICAPIDGGFYKLEKILPRLDLLNQLYLRTEPQRLVKETPNARQFEDTWIACGTQDPASAVVAADLDKIQAFVLKALNEVGADIIHLGSVAYKAYIEEAGLQGDRTVSRLPIEVLSEDGEEITTKVQVLVNQRIRDAKLPFLVTHTREYYHYFHFIGQQIALLAYNKTTKAEYVVYVHYNMKEAVTLTDYSKAETSKKRKRDFYIYTDACPPYFELPTGRRIGSYHLTLKYLCGVWHWLRQYRKDRPDNVALAPRYLYMTQQLRLAQLVWRTNKGSNADITDSKSLFRVAQTDDLLVAENLVSFAKRSILWKMFEKNEGNHKMYGRFSYYPNQTKIDSKDVKWKKTDQGGKRLYVGDKVIPLYPNESGGEIVNVNDRRIRMNSTRATIRGRKPSQ